MSDLITDDGQLQYNDYLLGDNERTFMVSLEGWDDLPGVDSGNALRPSGHGGWSGHKYLSERVITWEGRFAPLPEDWQEEIINLRNAFVVPEGTDELPIYIRTRTEQFVAFGVLTARSLPANKEYANYGASLILQFLCSDPRRYSVQENESVIGLAAPTEDGLEYPLVYPLDYGSAEEPVFANIVNSGNTATPVTITIQGPIENPSIVNQDTGKRLEFEIELTDTDTLVIDTRLGTVILNGMADRIYTRSLSSSPILSFNVTPGSNSLRVLAEDWEIGATITFTWRDATF